MGDLEVLTPLINSQDSLCSQDQISNPETINAWGRLYPENECLKIEGLSLKLFHLTHNYIFIIIVVTLYYILKIILNFFIYFRPSEG